MLQGRDYTACPECFADNVTSRVTCWKCGHAMPYTVDRVGQPHMAPAPRVVGRSEITRLLEQAELIVCEEESVPASSSEMPEQRGNLDASATKRVQRWLFGARNPAKSRT